MEHDEGGAGHPGLPPDLAGSGAFGDEDAELAAAIEASYRSQTQAGLEQSEDQLLAQAMHLSRLEEAERRRKLMEDLGEFDGEGGAGSARGPGGPSVMPYAGAGSSGSAASSSAASHLAPPPPRTRWAGPSAGNRGIEEDEDGSDAAVAGGSSRGSSREPGSPGRFHGGLSKLDDDVNDPHLAAAIEASYAAQTEHGMVSNEEDLIQQALRMSQMEEDSRQRAALKEQQEVELQESILMDQLREQEEKRRRVEEEELRVLEASKAAEEERQRVADQEAKRSRVPPEPPAGEPGRVDLQIRTPDGRRLRRAFRGSDTVGQVYDYIDVEGELGEACQAYRLVSTMPRREYEERQQTLQEAGLQGQCALLVERSEV